LLILMKPISKMLRSWHMYAWELFRRPTSAACCNSMDLSEKRLMIDRDKIQIDLIKLLNGERILRLTGPHSGLSLEKKLSPGHPIVRQMRQLRQAFEAALSRIELAAA